MSDHSSENQTKALTGVAALSMNRRSFLGLGALAVGGTLAARGSAEQEKNPDAPQRYPDSRIVVLDERFSKYKLINAAVHRIWTGAAWAEGCAWNAGGRYLVWSDIPNN